METVERATLLATLRAFPARLAIAARAADAAAQAADAAAQAADAAGPPPGAAGPPSTGDWGSNEVVRHLIAVEVEVHQARLTDIATVAEPRWSWTEPGPWPGEPSLSLDDVLDRFAALRAATIATAEALDEPGWARTGTHATLGAWDVAGLLANAVDHDEAHFAGLIAPA